MRKSSKRKPKGIRLDNMRWVVNGMKPVAEAKDVILNLRIKNHSALDVLRTGCGGTSEMDTIISAFNITEALARLRIGNELHEQIRAGQDALYALATRGARLKRFVFTGPELQAVNLVMEIHDAQLDVCTISELEKAIEIICHEMRSKRMRTIEMLD